MHRFLISPKSIERDIAVISGEDFKHMLQVLRFRIGERFLAFDGTGVQYEMELISIEKHQATGKIINKYDPGTEPGVEVILFQGMPKADKMDWIIQKSVELGVNRIIPVITQYTVFQIKNNIDRKLERWNRISREACKQCGRVIIPEVKRPLNYNSALRLWTDINGIEFHKTSIPVFCYENEGKKSLKDLFKCYNIDCVNTIGMFIGPEGGFSEDEIQLAKDYNISPVGLGKRILRTETAAVAVLSVIMHEYGDL